MSFHAGQTFTFGEQPSATKWQYLWDNDYALADGSGISDDALLSRHYAAKSVNAEALDAGVPVQIVQTDFSAFASSAGVTIPYDNTIPQIGEGFEVMTRSITPKFATSDLLVEAHIYGSINGSLGEFIGAMFRDATGNAIAADSVTVPGNGYLALLILRAKVSAASTSATTFRVRLGAAGTQNVAFNGFAAGGSGGTEVFSSASKSTLRVTEVRA